MLATISPVTQDADVDVKNAFKNPILSPFGLAMGRSNRQAPKKISAKKERHTIRGGFFFNFLIIIPS